MTVSDPIVQVLRTAGIHIHQGIIYTRDVHMGQDRFCDESSRRRGVQGHVPAAD